MKFLFCFVLIAFVSSEWVVDGLDVCPDTEPGFGICVFGDNNCIENDECAKGYLCCSDGCGKICKKAVKSKPKTGKCPEPSGLASICVFNPSRNCVSDNECGKGQKCCQEGCGSVCTPVVG